MGPLLASIFPERIKVSKERSKGGMRGKTQEQNVISWSQAREEPESVGGGGCGGTQRDDGRHSNRRPPVNKQTLPYCQGRPQTGSYDSVPLWLAVLTCG